MNIKSAEFIKGIVYGDEDLEDDYPQIAFIGRSNAGKSSLINSLTKQKNLARTSSSPGRTREINLFLINRSFYIADLPGYGYVKTSGDERKRLLKLINWYLFESAHVQEKVVLIIDASINPTDKDLEMLHRLEDEGKNIIIVANKIDKVKNSELKKQLQKIQDKVGGHIVVPYSSEKGIGINELSKEILEF